MRREWDGYKIVMGAWSFGFTKKVSFESSRQKCKIMHAILCVSVL